MHRNHKSPETLRDIVTKLKSSLLKMPVSGLPNGGNKYFFYAARKVRYLNAQKELGVQKKTGGALSGLLLCFIF